MVNVMNNAISSWTAFGSYFGFPDCCIASFERGGQRDVIAAFPDGPWLGSGFIPCMDCAPRAEKHFSRFVEEEIQPRRIRSLPFPADGDETPLEDENAYLYVFWHVKSRIPFMPLGVVRAIYRAATPLWRWRGAQVFA